MLYSVFFGYIMQFSIKYQKNGVIWQQKGVIWQQQGVIWQWYIAKGDISVENGFQLV